MGSGEGRDSEGLVTRPLVLFRVSVIISLLLPTEAGSPPPPLSFYPTALLSPRNPLVICLESISIHQSFVERLLCASAD